MKRTPKRRKLLDTTESLRKPDVVEKFRDMLHEKFEAAEETRDGVDFEAQWSQLKTINPSRSIRKEFWKN